jgi:hypothetical protein
MILVLLDLENEEGAVILRKPAEYSPMTQRHVTTDVNLQCEDVFHSLSEMLK